MKRFFVTGTDTGIGKTLASVVLTSVFNAHYWKPIQSGMADTISDRDTVQQLTGLPDTHFVPSNYELQASLSPDQAAELENISINLEQCILPEINNHLIVEGAGGVFVPLSQQFLMLDLIKKLNLPVVIVCRGTLGTINHTMLTIEALRKRCIPIQGVIFSGELNLKNKIAIETWGKVKTLFHIPIFPEITKNEVESWIKENKKNILEEFASC